uniref:ATP synthase F0 subunit 8 n=1 Tax=Platorchestia japonica TaxID=462861 RepID=A0A343S9Z2_9CRUS|nr:ATP synthase F0 subunit 8 [Platorchestia japonica]
MPQMAPIMWSYLFIVFNMTTLILSTKIFFQMNLNLTRDVTSTLNSMKKTWKL